MTNEITIDEIDKQIEDIKKKMSDPNLCEGSADVYTRCSGFYRPVSAFNAGKVAEFEKRLEYFL